MSILGLGIIAEYGKYTQDYAKHLKWKSPPLSTLVFASHGLDNGGLQTSPHNRQHLGSSKCLLLTIIHQQVIKVDAAGHRLT